MGPKQNKNQIKNLPPCFCPLVKNQWQTDSLKSRFFFAGFYCIYIHCCKVIAQARPFLRRLFDLSTTVQNLDRPIRITRSAKDDSQWWNYLLEGWNGRSFFLMDKWALPADFEISSNAAISNGCAAILGDSCWPDQLDLPHISILELVLIVLAASVWGMFWQSKRLIFKCDNSSVVSVLQNKSSKNRHLMKLLRRLAFFCN